MSGLPEGWVRTPLAAITAHHSGNGKLIKGKQHQEPEQGLFPAYSASGQDIWVAVPEHSGDAVIVSAVGARCGKAFLASGQWSAVANTHVVWPNCTAVDPRWLFLRLNDEDFWVKGGSAQPFVKVGATFERDVDLPPLDEQRRIVAKLDALTVRTARARADLDRIPALAARYKQAVLAAAISGELTTSWRESSGEGEWTRTTLKASFSVTTGNTPPKARSDCYGGNVPFVKPGDLDSGQAITRTTEGLTEAGFSVARQLPPGTVLVSCIGNLGKVGILGSAGSCNQQINAILPSPRALPKFIYYWAQTLKEWLEGSSSATTIAIVNKSRFEAAEIKLPPLDEQHEIVRRIDAAFAEIDRLTAEAAAARRLLDRLDQAILAKAFRGELVPQDPADEPASVLLERIRAERAAAPKPKRGPRKAAA